VLEVLKMIIIMTTTTITMMMIKTQYKTVRYKMPIYNAHKTEIISGNEVQSPEG